MNNLFATTCYDFAVIGGGIVGLATAMTLNRRYPAARIVLLEKEEGPARHQTGRNSGVIHSGIYYKPGSFKARFARAGRQFDSRVLQGTWHPARGVRQSDCCHA